MLVYDSRILTNATLTTIWTWALGGREGDVAWWPIVVVVVGIGAIVKVPLNIRPCGALETTDQNAIRNELVESDLTRKVGALNFSIVRAEGRDGRDELDGRVRALADGDDGSAIVERYAAQADTNGADDHMEGDEVGTEIGTGDGEAGGMSA